LATKIKQADESIDVCVEESLWVFIKHMHAFEFSNMHGNTMILVFI
jgi:hypothetical protein